MRRSVLVVLLAAACGVAVWSLATWAQDVDGPPCESACYDQNAACVSACGSHDNPVECEGACEDQLEDCLAQCG